MPESPKPSRKPNFMPSLRYLTVSCLVVAGCDRTPPPGPGAPSASVTASASAQASASSEPQTSASAITSALVAPTIAPPAQSADGCPLGMAKVGKSTCVDKWEAHLVTRDKDTGEEKNHPHAERPTQGVTYYAKSEEGVFPQGYVSKKESEAFCKASDKRLCSLGEWSRACRGKKWAMFPWGNNYKANACNVGKIHLLSKMYGDNGRAWKYDEHFNSSKLNQEPGFLAKTGEYEGCTGEEGVHDMFGNLHEWVSDVVTEDLVERMEKEPFTRKKQPWHEGNGIFMGGFFSTIKEHGPGCTFITIAHEPRYHDYSTGFRCCQTIAGEAKAKPTKR